MSEALLWAVTKSVLGHIASFAGDITCSYASQGILASQSVRNDLKKIENKLIAIRAVLHDAERKQYDSEAIKVWLKDLKTVVYDIDDLLDEVGTDLLRRRVNKGHVLQQIRYYLSSSNPVLGHFYWSQQIRDLLQSFDDIAANKRDLGLDDHTVETHNNIERNPLDAFSYVKKTEIIGRDGAKCEIVRRLTSRCVGNASKLVVLPIVGLGGIGKTALAKLVFNDEWVTSNFDVKLWACVSENFDLQKTIEEILNSVSNENTANLSLRQLHERLSEILLDGRKHFLVLDDVWIEDIKVWRDLESLIAVSEEGCVILVTTRSDMVASVVGNVEPYCLNNLSSDVCWSIFKQLAFKSGEEERYPNLARIGRNIVDKCGGVPLVVKVLASLLRSERVDREWMRIAETNNFLNIHPQHNDIKQALKVSYNKLPSHLKACFAYCSLFVKDSKLNPPMVSCLWSALGLLQRGDNSEELESVGYKYCEDLLSRSLLQDAFVVFTETVSECRMHDLFHDLATDIVGQEVAVVTSNQLNVTEICRHLVWGYEGGEGLSDKGFPKELLKAKKARTFRFGYAMGYINRAFIEGIIHNFRWLRVLDFHQSCFEELPRSIGNLKHLRYLDLSYNRIIKALPSTICKLLNLQSLFVPGCEMLQELPRDLDQLVSLRYFSVTTNQMSLASSKLHGLSCLGRLELYSCEELTSLWNGFSIQFNTSLLELHIVNCPKLISIPCSMNQLVSLETMVIRDCQELDLERGDYLRGLQNLRTLEITGSPKLRNLPRGIQSAASSLQYLWIEDCKELTTLPNWLKNFTLLRKINIYSCPKLVALPEGLSQLRCLQKIQIENCSLLSNRCDRHTGEDYPHISHVPQVYIDERCINGTDAQ
ncbi:disease resistance protein RGA2 [Spinacia oleracea]|uniref:Disease resistance protein RGA2 n=1 Tax=Spinacia oleracea TaxID=3562 RepID=A0A9R0J9B0_SPIOL|nr:disease resistance protein RGA2-like [Spinacia oleracea]